LVFRHWQFLALYLACSWRLFPVPMDARKRRSVTLAEAAAHPCKAGEMTRPDSIRWPGIVAAVCLLALAALEIAIMMEVGR